MKCMRFMVIGLAFLLVLCPLSGLTRVDLKAKIAEKADFEPILLASAWFLEQGGIKVVNVGEEYAVWFKDLKKVQRDGSIFMSMRLFLTKPSLAREGATLAEKEVKCSWPLLAAGSGKTGLDTPSDITVQDEGLIKKLMSTFDRMTDDLVLECTIAGKAAAQAIQELVLAVR